MTGRVILAIILSLALLAGSTAQELLHQAEEKIQKEQFSAAEPLLKDALRLAPSDVQVLYRLGYVQYRQRNLAEARKSFSAVVQTAPPAYNSRYFLGRIALLENKPQEAVKWLEPIVESKQAVFDTPSQIAAAYAGAGLRDKAIPALRAAIGEAPWDGSLYYRLGQLYSQSGQKELAQDAFENSRRLKNSSREDVETLMLTAQLIAERKTAEALRTGSQIRSRSDADPNALVALGVIYGNGNMQTEALDAFGRAAERDPKLFQAQLNFGLALLKLNRSSEAMAPLKRAMELLPQSPEANITFGLASAMNQRYADAVPPLERTWQDDSGNPRVGALLATSYLRTGAPAKAVAVLRADVFREPAEPAPMLLLIEALNATEDLNGALETALLAQKRFRQFPQAHMAVAQQLARLGRYQEARPAFEQTLKLNPGHPEAEFGLADVLQKSGDHGAALEHYRAAMNAGTTALAARTGLARSLTALRQFEEARKVLEQGVILHPSDTALRVELARVYARLGQTERAAEQTQIVDQLRGTTPAR